MNKFVKIKVENVLKATAKSVVEDKNKTRDERLDEMDTINNLIKIIDNYDELRPLLTQFFAKKAYRERFEKGKDKDE